MTSTLIANARTVKARKIADAAKMPAVFYGKGKEATSITVEKVAFEKLFEEAGESTVVTLDVDGEKIDTLIHEVSFHPVSGRAVHADFYVFDKNKKAEVSVEIVFVGEAPAEELGGIVVKSLHELEVSALPANLPSELTVDLSVLTTLESVIEAKDITLPSGVELITGAEEIIASVTEQRDEEEEEEAGEAPDMASIEVEKKGKQEDETGEEE